MLILPAYAGVIPCVIVVLEIVMYSSRVCGGDPTIEFRFFRGTLFFPRMRGWSSLHVLLSFIFFILPAYAGVIPVICQFCPCGNHSSRVCGGDPMVISILDNSFQFFPRMRGWSSYSTYCYFNLVILPAYAGVIPQYGSSIVWFFYSSRVCGGDPIRSN